MNLTDREILELNELCNAVIDETLTDAQRTRLCIWLTESEPARQFYVRALGQSASLHSFASEMHAEVPAHPLVSGPRRAPVILRFIGLLAAVATAVALVFWTFNRRSHRIASTDRPAIYVARLSAAKETKWAGAHALQPGALLSKGQLLELTAGYAEVTFDSGARVVLEGRTSLVINSAWDSSLRKGTLTASVPPQAIGFRVSNSSVEITDLGTEFSMSVDNSGATEVLVLKGEVEAAPRSANDQNTILLRERQSRRFDYSGVFEVSDSAEKFARFAQPYSLDRYITDLRFAHWSFDDTGSNLAGQYSGGGGVALPATLTGAAADLAQSHTDSQWRRGLRFDGALRVTTSFPGLSDLSPHTISFWVKVPEDAALSDAYAMVAWRSGASKLAYRPVQISWNRNPNEGALGALRTDFSGGCAIGTTSLRDGRWHHVAVVFTPGVDVAIPVQVKQYVDGRLESGTVVPGKIRGPAGVANVALNDVVWLGCRIGTTGPRQERFRGEIDELFIADRGLGPQEIVQLMTENRIPSSALAANAHAPAPARTF